MMLQAMALFTLTWSAVSAADPATIGLVFREGSPVPAAVRASFEQQTERGLRQIVSEPGLEVTWRAEGETARGESWARLIVLRFRGDCSLSMTKAMPRRGPLGATWVSDGRILPFIDIDCGRVKATLAGSGPWPQAFIPPGVLALALSHVALHEMYHVLTERAAHDADGLFKAAYSAEDLLAPAVLKGQRPAALTGFAPTR
jgi:hypothetical protein